MDLFKPFESRDIIPLEQELLHFRDIGKIGKVMSVRTTHCERKRRFRRTCRPIWSLYICNAFLFCLYLIPRSHEVISWTIQAIIQWCARRQKYALIPIRIPLISESGNSVTVRIAAITRRSTHANMGQKPTDVIIMVKWQLSPTQTGTNCRHTFIVHTIMQKYEKRGDFEYFQWSQMSGTHQ
jgi:hypothetical protein